MRALLWALTVVMVGVAVAARFVLPAPASGVVIGTALGVASWHAFGAVAAWVKTLSGVVLRFGGMEWTRDEVARHFLVTGETGTGKTARAVVPVLFGLRNTLRNTGILAIDSKGVLWQPVERIAEQLGQREDLRLIRVRPPEVPVEDWIPPLRLNLLADRSVPWTTYAKIIVDTATSAGQKGGQSFFKETARDLITHSMQALDLCRLPVTLENVFHVSCVSTGTDELLEELNRVAAPTAMAERQFFRDFAAQPVEQKGGIVSTVANFLRPYTPKDIAEVFCSVEPNFSLAELDAGRLVCLSVPQTYQVERKYLNLICKQLFFLHAFRRFDLDDQERRKRNLLVLALDEGQKTTLVSEDGFSDYTTVDELREAGVCVLTATQTPLAFHAAFGDEKKADVFMANMGTHIHFRAADEKGAKIISEKMGGREVRKYSGGFSGGKASRNWQLADEPWFKPHVLLTLAEGRAVIRHPRRKGVPFAKLLPCTALTRPNEFRAEAERMLNGP